MAALGSLVVKLALEYAQYTQGLDRASQESLTFAQNAQQNFDKAKGAVGDFAMNAAGALAGVVTAALTVEAALQRFNAAVARADEIDNLAQRLGVARSELQELSHVAMLSDTSLEGLGAGAKKLSVLMSEAAGGAEDAQAKLKLIGVSATDANGKLRTSTAVMSDIADKFADMKDGAGKTALAMEIFGKSGTDLIPLLNGGGAAIREASEEAHKFGLVMSDEGVAAAAAFGDGMDKLNSIIDGTFTQIADATLPVLASFTEALVDLSSGTDTVNSAAQKLNRDGTIRDWAIGAAKVLGFVVDAGQGVYRVFEIIGTTMGAAAAQAALVLSGDFKAAAAVGRAWADDLDAILTRELFSTKLNQRLAEIGKTIQEAESAGNDAPVIGKGKDKGKEKEALSDYQKLTAAINDRLTALGAEATATKALTESEKLAVKILSELRDGTKTLTDEEKRALATSLETMILSEQANEQRKEETKDREKLIEARKSEIEALNKTVDAAEAEVENFGKLPSAITASTIAKLEARRASALLTGDLKGEVDHIDKLIEANRRLANAQGTQERLDAEKAAADQAANDWKATAEKIEGDLTDALMRGFENGKGFAENLRDVVVNMFKTMILRPTIQAVVQGGMQGFTGGSAGASGSSSSLGSLANMASFVGKVYQGFQSGGIAGGFNALTGGFATAGSTLGGMVSGFGNLVGSSSISAFGAGMGMTSAQAGTAAAAYNGAGMASTGSAINAGAGLGAAANVVGGLVGGHYLGRAVSGGYSAFGGSGNSAVNTGTAIGAAIGSIVPVLGTALGAIVGGLIGGAANRLFGHKKAEVTEQGIDGYFTGHMGEFNSGTAYSNWVAKGGVFRSDKRGYEREAMDAEQQALLSTAFRALKDANRDYAGALGLNADVVNGYTKSMHLVLTNDAAKNEELIAGLFVEMNNEIATRLIPNIADLARNGETAGATLDRLVTSTRTVNEWFRIMGRDATEAFGAAGVASAVAKQRIVDLAGGLEGFAAQSSFFADNFLTDAERMAPVIEAVDKAMVDLGQGSVKTKEQFAALVKGIDLSSESGQNLYAALMALAPAFLQVANYAEALEVATAPLPALPSLPGAAADQAPVATESLDTMNKRRSMEIEILRLTGNEVAALKAERDLELAALDDSLKPLKERIWALQDAAEAERQAKADAAEAERFWAGQVEDARGKLTAAYDRESSALKTTIDRFRDFSRSLRDFRDSLLTGNMSTLSPEAKYQASKAQFDKTYSLALAGDPEAMAALEGVSNEFLQASKDYNASSEQYARDFDKVRSALGNAAKSADTQVSIASRQLAALDKQVAGLVEINESVLSVVEAIGALNAAKAAHAVVKTGTSGTGKADEAFVESLYGQYLGRASDAPGLAFWTDAMKRGATPADVIAGFLGSDEFKTRKFAEGGVFTNGVVSQPTKFNIGEMGEAGPEAILPLARTSKGLGVRMVGAGGGSDAALAAKLDAVLVELRAANVQRGAAAGAQMAKLEQVAEAVDATNRQLARA